MLTGVARSRRSETDSSQGSTPLLRRSERRGSIRDDVKRLHLEVRGGIHTGECEIHGADLAGIAIHVAARIVALADPSEILVSQTVRDLTAGSGIHFAARGKHDLKGSKVHTTSTRWNTDARTVGRAVGTVAML